jgi:hypothetical protein
MTKSRTKEKAMPTNVRSRVIELIEDGTLDWESICRACLDYMSVDDVDDMMHSVDPDWDDLS